MLVVKLLDHRLGMPDIYTLSALTHIALELQLHVIPTACLREYLDILVKNTKRNRKLLISLSPVSGPVQRLPYCLPI